MSLRKKKKNAPARNTKRPARPSEPPCHVPPSTKEQAPCEFCKQPCNKADSFCYGCKTVVCDKCDVSCGNYRPGHSAEAHLVPFEA